MPISGLTTNTARETRELMHASLQHTERTLHEIQCIAHEANDTLAFQEEQIRHTTRCIENEDRRLEEADVIAGKVNSCCGYGFWHWLKMRLCCAGGKATAVKEMHQDEIERLKKLACAEVPPLGAAHPTPVPNDSIDQEMDRLSHEVECLRQDAEKKHRELALQNEMLKAANETTAVTVAYARKVHRYEEEISDNN